jgi:NAD+ kinase
MGQPFRHAALIGKYQAVGMRHLLEDIAHFLERSGVSVVLERNTALNTGLTDFGSVSIEEASRSCDVVIVVGGDGTMLGIARQVARYDLPVIGINQGRLGFITDVPIDGVQDALRAMLQGKHETEHRTMIEGGIWRDGERIFEGLSLNDVVVSRGATASMVDLRVEIDGQFMTNIRADGLILASPTGSTAYALSAGGPILHPSIAGWVLVPIASHTLSNRPIVVPDRGEVCIEIIAGRDASANFDMQSLASLLHGDQIRVRRSAHTVGWSYYGTLRRKLRWNEGAT